jgi:hypothetical protein
MRDELENNEWSIEEAIQIELCGVEAVIEAVGDDDSPDSFFEIRDQLRTLLGHVRSKQVHPEYAEVQLDKIVDQRRRWLNDNPIPPDPEEWE